MNRILFSATITAIFLFTGCHSFNKENATVLSPGQLPVFVQDTKSGDKAFRQIIDDNSYVKYSLLNDTTYAMEVNISGVSSLHQFPYIDDQQMELYIPKFFTRYGNMLIFLSDGTMSYKKITTFPLENERIKMNTFENNISYLNNNNSEELVFLMKGYPALLSVRTKKIHLYTNICINDEIDEIDVFKDYVVLLCQQGKRVKLLKKWFAKRIK